MAGFEVRPTIVVSHTSALSALRDERMRFSRIRWEPISIEEQRHVLSTTRPSVHAIDEIELLRIGALSPYAPLEALVGSKTQRTRNPELRVHSVTSKLPSGALLRVQPDLYIVSPAFAVTQCAARSKSLPATLALIYELCGSFTMPESLEDQLTHPRGPVASEDRPTYQEAEPALTLADLKKFLKAASSVYGSSLARKAADQALEGARSPMEAISCGMYHTAQPLGGFGIKTILLNHRIDFNEIARAASSLPYAVCDA